MLVLIEFYVFITSVIPGGDTTPQPTDTPAVTTPDATQSQSSSPTTLVLSSSSPVDTSTPVVVNGTLAVATSTPALATSSPSPVVTGTPPAVVTSQVTETSPATSSIVQTQTNGSLVPDPTTPFTGDQVF